MALGPYFLGDTSALALRSTAAVADRLDPLLEAGLVARCAITDLEAGYSSTSPREQVAIREPRQAWPFVPMDQEVLDRAATVQDRLAERSQHREAKIADLLIAAVAESAGLVVLRYGRDFDLIAGVPVSEPNGFVRAGTVP